MNVWAIIWVAVVSIFCALGIRNALRLYRDPREVRTTIGLMSPKEARRAALGALVGMPIVWLIIALSSFGLLGRSPFETGAN